jgi:hypothetical protein
MWKARMSQANASSADLWGQPTPWWAPCLVLSPGGCQVGPQGNSKYPRGFEVVWERWWAIGSM